MRAPGGRFHDDSPRPALGMKTSSYDVRQEIIIDPATGQPIGEREVLRGIPAGTATAWTAVTTSVVDSAP
ncbi:hypothetical protein [Arthrobacter sp. zg-Y769]|uniref:hypothetical protein n=1 Tax=Arthrobacter sp. zg-Y769 TaxID=2894191 RepID=UPI001E2FA7E3|nr:hypothetical protein [Arthrobacter sp. zg-Y769]MCC9205782.1 hypothetical protein [Arthrobacter sp. zg-Y769]